MTILLEFLLLSFYALILIVWIVIISSEMAGLQKDLVDEECLKFFDDLDPFSEQLSLRYREEDKNPTTTFLDMNKKKEQQQKSTAQKDESSVEVDSSSTINKANTLPTPQVEHLMEDSTIKTKNKSKIPAFEEDGITLSTSSSGPTDSDLLQVEGFSLAEPRSENEIRIPIPKKFLKAKREISDLVTRILQGLEDVTNIETSLRIEEGNVCIEYQKKSISPETHTTVKAGSSTIGGRHPIEYFRDGVTVHRKDKTAVFTFKLENLSLTEEEIMEALVEGKSVKDIILMSLSRKNALCRARFERYYDLSELPDARLD